MVSRLRYVWLIIGFFSLVMIWSCTPGEIPVSEGTADINGSEIYYKIIGEGQPLFIVHGGPVLDHSYFLPHLENLARDYQLIFYDQRATGRSSVEVDSSKMNLEAFVEDIDLLREKLGFDKINLLGHSWGGLLAMAYGTEHSDKLDHLILSNSMAPNVQDWQRESAAVARQQTPEDEKERQGILDSLRTYPGQRLELIEKLLMTSFKPQMFDRSNLQKLKLYIPEDYDQRRGAYRWLGPDMNTFNYDLGLANISCPTLIIYGETEPAITVYSDKMLELIPNAQLSVIEEAGHFPFIEEPKAFRKIVTRFLDK